ncbi:MAG: MYG1 family protein [bacterium]
MSIFKKKKILVTHSGTFHADDIFATAMLTIMLDGNVKVIRTRDESIMKTADFLYDEGGVYDPSKNRFDHHQSGGAGARENGIQYAACGLVWKTYGEKICGGAEIAKKIDERLVQAIDANDNGMSLFDVKGEVGPYTLQDMFYSFRPSWKEPEEYDDAFMDLVDIAIGILDREIIRTRDMLEAESRVKADYENSTDKRIIILDQNYPWGEFLMQFPEPIYAVYLKAGLWRAEGVRKEKFSVDIRHNFPNAWGGLRDEELAKVTGVPDAVFCHRGLFLAVAKSKEGVLKLAETALNTPQE